MIFSIKNKEKLKFFYEDGLKDCSWIPNTFKEFLDFYKDFTFVIPPRCEYMVIFDENRKFIYLDTIYVIRSCRGHGVATEVMKEIVNGPKKVMLFCNRNLISFYEKFGFKPENELAYAILMKEEN